MLAKETSYLKKSKFGKVSIPKRNKEKSIFSSDESNISVISCDLDTRNQKKKIPTTDVTMKTSKVFGVVGSIQV